MAKCLDFITNILASIVEMRVILFIKGLFPSNIMVCVEHTSM